MSGWCATTLAWSSPSRRMAPSAPAQPALLDLPQLAERGAAEGIELQLASPWTDLLGYTLSEPEAVAWTRAYNESLAAACAGQANLLPLATIPLQYPGLAASELEAASQLGCRGAVVGTDIPGIDFDSPQLDPVWEAAAKLTDADHRAPHLPLGSPSIAVARLEERRRPGGRSDGRPDPVGLLGSAAATSGPLGDRRTGRRRTDPPHPANHPQPRTRMVRGGQRCRRLDWTAPLRYLWDRPGLPAVPGHTGRGQAASCSVRTTPSRGNHTRSTRWSRQA